MILRSTRGQIVQTASRLKRVAYFLIAGLILTLMSFFAGSWNELSLNRDYGWPLHWYIERGAQQSVPPFSLIISQTDKWFNALIPGNLLADWAIFSVLACALFLVRDKIVHSIHKD
jgi:hypothetical protein